ncbi:hypothetical protein [Pelagibaculum spongiae]|uniref:IPTL-CTERM protein sorting domain-containing protein n=1 Tax=Pelagibaculum spongiae TaxID=2080658 RepID=A0A2V1GV55_9GAMM|nr:hypothetical protein [Pelagibaculum spongiae]PVZ68221.1 hypothetical protein DC094_13055 [Pelagibaculum spongiae]
MKKVLYLALGLAALAISSVNAQDLQVTNSTSSAIEEPFTIVTSVGYDQTNSDGNSDQLQTVAIIMEFELQGEVSASSDDINCNPPVNTPSQTIMIACSDIILQSGTRKAVAIAITPASSNLKPIHYTASLTNLNDITNIDSHIDSTSVHMTDQTNTGSGSLAWGFIIILMGLALARSQKPKNSIND